MIYRLPPYKKLNLTEDVLKFDGRNGKMTERKLIRNACNSHTLCLLFSLNKFSKI